MKYNCLLCVYETDDRTSWYNHKKSKKHKYNELIENQQKDKGNNIELLNSQHEIELLKEKLRAIENEKNIIKQQLDETKKQCEKQLDDTKKQISETKKQIDETRKQYEKQIEMANREKDKRIEEIKEHVETLQNENQFQKQLINSAGGMIKKSMNTLSYLLLNYKNAPHIKELSDYSIISKNMMELIKNITHYYNKNKLEKFMGDFIIRQYKKDEPELQSLWSSDTDRLNYFICELIKEQNNNKKKEETGSKTHWILDKKGIIMSKYVIDPLLEYILGINSNYINDKNDELNDMDDNETKNTLKEMQVLASINADIKNNKLSNGINKYIAPHFYFDRKQSLEN